MNYQQINAIIKMDQTATSQHGGVFPSDGLPTYIFKRPRFFIANTDPHNKPGRHWVAFYFPKRGPAEFFDSGGRPPSKVHRNFTKFLKKHTKRYVYNKRKLQSVGSNACGPFVMYYVMHRALGVPMNKIANKFNRKELSKNDRHVTEWLEKIADV